MIATEPAYAKINLALHVRCRREDGYHELETVFAFCDSGDTVAGELSADPLVKIEGPFAQYLSNEPNLVSQAAGLFDQSARIILTKRLPIASGLGGGSADAAATLRLLSQLTGTPIPPLTAQRALGADVPACVVSRTMRGEGVGDRLTLANGPSGAAVLLINPRKPLSTAAVFAGWDGVDRGPLDDWRDGRNDLEASAYVIVPEIFTLLDWLRRRHDVILARMSGSGATCFALFNTVEARVCAAREAACDWPNYWTMESVLR